MSTENLFESIEPATNLIAEPRNNFFLEAKALIKLFYHYYFLKLLTL